jgi:hypothetical protein
MTDNPVRTKTVHQSVLLTENTKKKTNEREISKRPIRKSNRFDLLNTNAKVNDNPRKRIKPGQYLTRIDQEVKLQYRAKPLKQIR